MWNNIIGAHIQRVNRNLLLTNLILLLGLLFLALLNARYLENFLLGPFPISAEKLASTQNPESLRHYYVRVQAEKALDTGTTEVEQERSKYGNEVKSERVTAHFLLIKIGEKILLVKANSAEETTLYTGALIPIPEKVNSEVVGVWGSEADEIRADMLPYMLDATDFRMSGYIGLVVGIPTILLVTWNLLKYLKRAQDPAQHPIARQLQKYGSPTDIAFGIDSEARVGGQRFGSLQLLPSWMLQSSTYGLEFLRLDDLAWAYKKVTQHSVNLIPTGKSFTAVLWDRHGRKIEVQLSDNDVMQLLGHLLHRNPWMMAGYDAARNTAWSQNRASVVQAIDNQRQQMMAAGNAPAAPAPPSSSYRPPPSV